MDIHTPAMTSMEEVSQRPERSGQGGTAGGGTRVRGDLDGEHGSLHWSDFVFGLGGCGCSALGLPGARGQSLRTGLRVAALRTCASVTYKLQCGVMIELRYYVTTGGRNVFADWLDELKDETAEARIALRLNRLASGNFGDCKRLGEGVWELRINWGPGYRLYYAMMGRSCVLLLGGGDKRKQTADIARAIACWNDYKMRMAKQ